jgi:DNA replication and repair protein RecF
MRLSRLQVRHVRILERVGLEPAAGLNVIEGANASGKTSLLEAIHLLGLGRSFRTRKIREVITRDRRELVVFGEGEENGRRRRLGVEKAVCERTTIQIDGQKAKSASELAACLPLVIVTPDSHSLISGAPSQRRAMIDWGVFHVERTFYRDWLIYHRALKQRNAALKNRAGKAELAAWDGELAESGERIALERKRYVDAVRDKFVAQIGRLLPGCEVDFQFRRGWDAKYSLQEALLASQERDSRVGFTTVGPHRTELIVLTDGRPAVESVSRGQQKLLVLGLRLGQLELFREATGRAAVLLIDDLPAELDREKRVGLLTQLANSEIQLFVTTTDSGQVEVDAWHSWKLFHVEQGSVKEVV